MARDLDRYSSIDSFLDEANKPAQQESDVRDLTGKFNNLFGDIYGLDTLSEEKQPTSGKTSEAPYDLFNSDEERTGISAAE